MCNDITDRELGAYLKRKRLNRRGFNKALGAATLIASLPLTACSTETSIEAPLITEADVEIPSPDGMIDGKFFSPASGTHAAVIFWPDIHGVRPAFFDMARRLAEAGYAVIAANPYYRTHKGRLFQDGMTIRDEGGWELAKPHYESATPETIVIDANALVAWLDTQDAVDTNRAIGAVGFCMTGSWTLRSAAAVSARVKAPVSFHGGGLVTDEPTSPHRLADQIDGGVLIAIAENDHERQPEAQNILIEAFEAAAVPAEIEVYEDAMHGWVPTDSLAHNPEQSERAWARMLALFDRELST